MRLSFRESTQITRSGLRCCLSQPAIGRCVGQEGQRSSPSNIISMRYTLSTCTQTRSLTFHAKPDDILVQHVGGVFLVLCVELSNSVYSLYPSPCQKCNNEPRSQSIQTILRQSQDGLREILSSCGFISEKAIRHPSADLEISVKSSSV